MAKDQEQQLKAQKEAQTIKENLKYSNSSDSLKIEQTATIFGGDVNIEVTSRSGKKAEIHTDGKHIETHGDEGLTQQVESAAKGGNKISMINESGVPNSPLHEQANQLLDASILTEKERTELLEKTNPMAFKNSQDYLEAIKLKAEKHEAAFKAEERNQPPKEEAKNADARKEKESNPMRDAYKKVTGHRGIDNSSHSSSKPRSAIRRIGQKINQTVQRKFQNLMGNKGH